MYETILIPIKFFHAELGKAMINVAKGLGGEGARIILVHVVEDIPTYVAAELPSGIIE